MVGYISDNTVLHTKQQSQEACFPISFFDVPSYLCVISLSKDIPIHIKILIPK